MPVVAVDGALGAPGLELSHWPGHATPATLRHELSTGSALAFARLPSSERERRAQGAVEIVNNHYDTDGTCALFAVRHPERALSHANALLTTASSGDFFRALDEAAFVRDCVIQGATDPARSPLDLAGADDAERWQRATTHWLEHLDALMAGDVEPYRVLWESELEAYRSDRAALAAAARKDDSGLDLATWAGQGAAFRPGRHALFAAASPDSTARDRVLAIGAEPDGWTYRLVVSTLSWFDLPNRVPRPRGDLTGLAAALNDREDGQSADGIGWHAQRAESASPELWFGSANVDLFAEHNDALLPSRLPPPVVRAELERFLG